MAETAGSLKYVIGQILDTWSRGPSVIPLISDISGEMPNGDTIDAFPSMVAPTVATSESASVESSSISVTQLIKKVAANRTVLMVEHNMNVVGSIADTITVLARGTVIAEGTYAQVSKNPQVLEAYMGSEATELQGAHGHG